MIITENRQFPVSFKARALLLAIVLIAFAVGVWLRIDAPMILGNWVARDAERAMALLDGSVIALAGPESNWGGRLPGPALQILMAIPLVFSASLDTVYLWNLGLNLAAIGILFAAIWRFFDPLTACITAFLLSINVILVAAAQFPFNPSHLFIFQAGAFYFCLSGYFTRHSSHFFVAFVLLSLAMQVHLTALNMLFSVFLIYLASGGVRLRHLWWLLWIGLLFAPFLYYTVVYEYPAGIYGSIKDGRQASGLAETRVASLFGAFVAIAFLMAATLGRLPPLAVWSRYVVAVILGGLLVWFGWPQEYAPYQGKYRELMDVVMLGLNSHFFYFAGAETALMDTMRGIFDRHVVRSGLYGLQNLFLLAIVPAIFVAAQRLGAASVEKAVLVAVLLFAPLAAIVLHNGGPIATPHWWYYFHLVMPTALFMGLSVSTAIRWLYFETAKLTAARGVAHAVTLLLAAVGLFYAYQTVVMQSTRFAAVKAYVPDNEQGEYSQLATFGHDYTMKHIHALRDELKMSAEDFTRRTVVLSRMDNALNHYWYRSAVDGKLGNYSLHETNRPEFYQSGRPCLYVELKDRSRGPRAEDWKKRFYPIIEKLGEQETAGFRLIQYRLRYTDYCFSNTWLSFALTADHLVLRSALDPDRPVRRIAIRRERDANGDLQEISARFAVFIASHRLPVLLDIALTRLAPQRILVTARFDSDILSSRQSLTWGGTGPAGRQFLNAGLEFSTNAGPQRLPVVTDPSVTRSIFGHRYSEAYLWPGFFPIGLRRELPVAIDDIDGASFFAVFEGPDSPEQAVSVPISFAGDEPG